MQATRANGKFSTNVVSGITKPLSFTVRILSCQKHSRPPCSFWDIHIRTCMPWIHLSHILRPRESMQYYMAVSYPPTAVLYRNTRKHGSIKSFLSKRSFQVNTTSFISSSYPQIECVPQGSVSSITLFLTAVNNIISILSPGTRSPLRWWLNHLCLRSIHTHSPTTPSVSNTISIFLGH